MQIHAMGPMAAVCVTLAGGPAHSRALRQSPGHLAAIANNTTGRNVKRHRADSQRGLIPEPSHKDHEALQVDRSVVRCFNM